MPFHALQRFSPFPRQTPSSRPRSYNDRYPAPYYEEEKRTVYPEVSQMSVQSSEPLLQVPPEPPVAGLKVKKVDHYFSRWKQEWKYKKSSSEVIPEDLLEDRSAGWGTNEWSNPEWKDCCFVIVRELPHYKDDPPPFFKLVITSPYLVKLCVQVLGYSRNIVSYKHLELNPKQFIPFLPKFKAYRSELSLKLKTCPKADKVEFKNLIATIDVVLDYYQKNYKETLAAIERLRSREEITFDLLFAIFLPGTIVVQEDNYSGELRASRVAFSPLPVSGERFGHHLDIEGTDVFCNVTDSAVFCTNNLHFGAIPHFQGIVKISSLNIFPLQYHPRENEVRKQLIERGKKWAKLSVGIHHMQYQGMIYRGTSWNLEEKYTINSRVMIDKGNFFKYANTPLTSTKKSRRRRQGQYCGAEDNQWDPPPQDVERSPSPVPTTDMVGPSRTANIDLKIEDLKDEDLLVAGWVLYGFSLADKIWIQMNVSHVSEIEWNHDAFANLVIPENRKTLLQSLVEAHNEDIGFDDFVKGKGRGLVVSLFGPPGVGKTYSAEATCEHVQRPLYLIGAGDLGTTASELDTALQRSFKLASAWKAIILIDEADVFLEKRSFNELERNAMVAVFLRHLEYYPAIIFLTTNRVTAFDEAFHSRIHVALRFRELNPESLKAVWTAFLKKVGVTIFKSVDAIGPQCGVSEKELEMLSQKKLNGRQVKNSVKTALSLAVVRGEALRYKHLLEVLEISDDFDD